MKILVPKNCEAEVLYTVSVLLKECRNVDLSIAGTAPDNNIHFLAKNRTLTIENHFFVEDDYQDFYREEKIPRRCKKKVFELIRSSYPAVILFGGEEIKSSEKATICCFDLISSAFFMLSRWEECVVDDSDMHGRFKSSNALSVREDFIDRPLVDEYSDLLQALLNECGQELINEHKPSLVPTHDVDRPWLWPSPYLMLKDLTHRTIRRRWKELPGLVRLATAGKDPFDNFTHLLDLAEERNATAHFYFMTGGTSRYDNRYLLDDPRILAYIAEIQTRGHQVGIHPSYSSHGDADQLGQELATYRRVIDHHPTSGRQHYLRFGVPTTWQLWEDAGLQVHSSASYADRPGFSCGTCHSFPVFNILTRKTLNLKEQPLLIMEGALKQHVEDPEQAVDYVRQIQSQVRQHRGEFVFLWHNSSFHTEDYLGWTPVLEQMYAL